MQKSVYLRLLVPAAMVMTLPMSPLAGQATAATKHEPAGQGQVRPGKTIPRPDLNGKRMKSPNAPQVYLIDEGRRRWIPNPETYNNLFRDWNGIVITRRVRNIDRGPDISTYAMLVRGIGDPKVYLIDNGQKRWITSPAAMDRYYFDWDKVKEVPPGLLEAIPDGPDIDA